MSGISWREVFSAVLIATPVAVFVLLFLIVT
jgi:hypothetical protein